MLKTGKLKASWKNKSKLKESYNQEETCATPIKSIFSLPKAGKLRASLKKAEGKQNKKQIASYKQAKGKLKAS